MKERLRERLLAVGAAVGYPIFYVMCLLIFSALTFPFDKVRDRIVASFNEASVPRARRASCPSGRSLRRGSPG